MSAVKWQVESFFVMTPGPSPGAGTPGANDRLCLQTRFVGMMQYDGDLKLPARFLVPPPAISGTSGELLAKNGITTFACSETQKFGHVRFCELRELIEQTPLQQSRQALSRARVRAS